MKERPIIFSAPMVRAIMDGTKTMTRRVVKPQPQGDYRGSFFEYIGGPSSYEFSGSSHKCPYGQPGDRLWVRESFAIICPDTDRCFLNPESMSTCRDCQGRRIIYKADSEGFSGSWRPSIHMPRWASRITLEIVSVRVERLWYISYDNGDIWAEGIPAVHDRNAEINSFIELWDGINAKRPDCSWEDNPWVWVIEFKRLPQAN